MSELSFKEYKRLVEQQSQALLEAMQSVALGDLETKVEIPEGIDILADLAVGIEIMVDDLRAMMAEQVRADLVKEQSRALLDAVQSVAIGNLDIEVDVPEGIEVLSELAIGVEMMIDDLREMLAGQERARAEIETSRQQLEAALQEVLAVQRRHLREEWREYAAEETASGYYRADGDEGPTGEAWLPPMGAAVEEARPVAGPDGDVEAALAIPIKLYDEVIGVIGFSREEAAGWDQEEIDTVQAIVEQMGWALESQRLFDEEQQARGLLSMRVNELDCLNDIGRKIDETPPVPELLDWIVGRIPAAMQHPDLCRVAIELEGRLYGAAEARELPKQMVQSLYVGGQPVGRIHIAYTEPHDFLDEESALLGDIARRIGGYVENQRLFAETQARAEELAVLNELARALAAQLDVDQVLDQIYRGISRLLDATNCFVGLYDPKTETITFPLNVSESVLEKEIVSMSPDEGLTGYIFRTRESVLIRDDVSAWLREHGIEQVGETAASWLGVPLLIGDEVLGVMAVQSFTVADLYDEHDRELMTAIASQAAVAIQNARLFEETQKALEETAMLFRVAQGLARAETQQEMFELVLTEYLQVLGLPQGGVMTVDRDGDQATLHALVQEGQLVEAGMRLPVADNPPTLRALENQEPVVIRDALDDPLTASTPDLVEQLGYRSLLLVPIIVRGEAIGLLGADSVDEIHEFSEREINLVRAVADQLGIALENQRLLEETQAALDETEALYRVARSVSAFESLPDTLQAIVDSVAKALPADRVALYTLDFDAERVIHLVKGGPEADKINEVAYDELWEGLTGWVLREQKPALSPKGAPDEREDAEAQKRRAKQGSGSIIVVPMQYRGRTLGTLTAINRLDDPDFTSRDVDLMMAMTNQASAALENVRLFEETRRRAEEQAILNEIGQALIASQDVAGVWVEAYHGVTRLLDTDSCYFTFYDSEQDELHLALQVIEGQMDRPGTLRPGGRGGLTDYLIETKRPLLLPDRPLERIQELDIAEIPLQEDRISQSWLGVPMMLGDRVVGTIVALNYKVPHAYDERSQAVLVALANQTAIALDNVRLLEQTRTALAEVEATHRNYLQRAWQDHLRQREMLDRSSFLYDRSRLEEAQGWSADAELWRPEIERAVQEGRSAVSNSDDGDGERAGLAIPIRVRGQTIGVLGVEVPAGNRRWTEEDQALLEAVGDQLGQTLETARLFSDTQRRAERERLIGEITAKIRASTDMRDILETAATELGQALGTSRALIRIGTEDFESKRQGGRE